MIRDFEDFLTVSPTRERASLAFGCYCAIRLLGVDKARELYRKSTWYRHLSLMRELGLTLEQLQLEHREVLDSQPKEEGVRLVRV
jgi:hypothetical protein